MDDFDPMRTPPGVQAPREAPDARSGHASNADVVLVTNVGQGFGRAVALGFGARGYDVVCADRDVALASRTAAEIEEAGGQAIPIQADMTTHLDVDNAFRKVHEIFGRLGGVAHVAAHVSHTALRDLGEPEFAELFEEDVRSVFLVLRAAERQLGEGWIVLVGPPRDAASPPMAAVRAAMAGFATGRVGRPGRRSDPHGSGERPRLRVNLVSPSRGPSDPAHDRRLVETALFLGSTAAAGVASQIVDVDLPPPPQVTDTLLPEVRAALDASVTQEDLDSELEDELEDELRGDDAAFEDDLGGAEDGEFDGAFASDPDGERGVGRGRARDPGDDLDDGDVGR